MRLRVYSPGIRYVYKGGGGLGDSSKDDELMKKYLTKDEAEGLQSWDKVCL